jgi:hypothetical protein
MKSLTLTPQQVQDSYEWAVNTGPIMNGRADALAHIGKLTSGEWTPEALTGIQADVLEDADPAYRKGYTEAWNAITALINGVAVDDLHNV